MYFKTDSCLLKTLLSSSSREVFLLVFNQQELFSREFFHLLNKVNIYEVVEVKGKLVTKGATIDYWDSVDISSSCIYIFLIVDLFFIDELKSIVFPL